MKILAIDPGSQLGWAFYANGMIESGVQDFSLKRGESKGMRFIRFRAWLKEIVSLTRPEVVIYEMPHQRGGFATEVLIGMTTRIQEICEEEGVEYNSIHSATLKKFATGSGRASKEDMLNKAREKWGKGEVIDHNHADALFIMLWAKEEFGK